MGHDTRAEWWTLPLAHWCIQGWPINQLGFLVLGRSNPCLSLFYFTAQETGYSLTDDELNRAFLRFKDLADKKKELTSLDLASIVNDEIRDVNIRRYELVGMQVRRLVRGSGLVLRRAIAYSGWRRHARARQAPLLTCVCVLI